MALWYILCPFDCLLSVWYIFPLFLVFCVKKNLATQCATFFSCLGKQVGRTCQRMPRKKCPQRFFSLEKNSDCYLSRQKTLFRRFEAQFGTAAIESNLDLNPRHISLKVFHSQERQTGRSRGCQILRGAIYQNGENVPKCPKI
jgi:hypothetical protein